MRHTDPNEHKLCRVCGAAFYYRDHMHSYKKRKYCSIACYRQELKHTPERALALFWSRINKDAPNGCWEYTYGRDKWGYGDLQYLGKHIQAHRLAWTLLKGDPGKLDCLHKCHNPPCCNPDHLYLGDDYDNSRDRVEARRHVHGERSMHAKLTAAQVFEIRAKYQRTMSGKRTVASNAKELAAEYGVGPGTIANAALGSTWKYTK